MSWRGIADVLAREANFRAQREMDRGRSLNVITTKSALRYNLFLLVMLSFISSLVGLASFEGREAALMISILLFLIEVMVGVQSMALNLQVIISDELLEPLQHLPVREVDLRKALSLLGIYWGGLALPFTMIPAGLIASIILNDPLIFIGFTLASITALMLSQGLGYFAGSIGGRESRSLINRAISTMLWTSFMSLGFAISPLIWQLSIFFKSAGNSIEMMTFLPPLSFMLITRNAIAPVSSALFLLLCVIILRQSTMRFWRAATSPEVIAPKNLPKWALDSGIWGGLMRELKMISRNPKILAALLVYAIAIPAGLLGPILEKLELISAIASQAIFPIFSLSVGGLQASFSPYFYIIESAGARALYQLPLSRWKLSSTKALSIMVLNAIPISLLSAALLLRLGPGLVITPLIFYIASFSGTTYLNCLIYAKMLPKEPVNWNVETFGRGMIGMPILLQVVIYSALMMLAILSTNEGSVIAAALIYLKAVCASSIYLAYNLRRDPL